MIKFNKIILSLLIALPHFVFCMDHGDICMSSIYYKRVSVEKCESLNHKPFSTKCMNSFVVRDLSNDSLKNLLNKEKGINQTSLCSCEIKTDSLLINILFNRVKVQDLKNKK